MVNSSRQKEMIFSVLEKASRGARAVAARAEGEMQRDGAHGSGARCLEQRMCHAPARPACSSARRRRAKAHEPEKRQAPSPDRARAHILLTFPPPASIVQA